MKTTSLYQAVLMGTLMLIPSLAYAGEKVDKSLDAQSDGVVEIHNVRGDIRVIAWDNSEVKVTGELDDLTAKFIFESQGKVTYLKVEIPRRNANRGDGSDLKIMVPRGSRVDFNGVSTDLLLEQVEGGVDLRSVSGDLKVHDVKEQLFLNTVSGDIDVKNSAGQAKLNTVSGDIEAEMDSSEVSVNAVSGDIRLALKSYNSLVASTVNGEIWVTGQQQDGGKSMLSSVNGDITLSFDDAVNARVSIKSGPGGSIRNSISSDPVEDVFPNQQRLRATLGDGSGQIKAGTVNGSITLKGHN